MERWQAISAIIVIVAPAAVIVYDVIIRLAIGREATITHVVQQWALKHEDMPYAVAGLFLWLWLHLFFRVVTSHA